MRPVDRQYPVGAELISRDHASLRVWAPDHDEVEAVVDGATTRLQPEGDGHFSTIVRAHASSRYGFRLPGDDRLYPDPASRWMPDGPDGLSAMVDLGAYAWRDSTWRGIALPGQVLYELHIGTCSRTGTWRAAEALLPRLREVGITVVQMMPVAEFAGRFGWGYDGVQWFAPTRNYGEPQDLQHFIDTAHQAGLGVILDVVYNHLGPSGNFLGRFDRRWQSARHANEWGAALNFDDEGGAAMRRLLLSNVRYWIREFHFDGFRVDAAQQIFDDSADHVLAALGRCAREAAGARNVLIVAEHEGQNARLIRAPAVGGYGLDAIFNEDFHHSCRVALTGVREAYFSDYAGTSREWLGLVERGFLFQGQYYPWQKQPRGTPALDCDAAQFVGFLENHDQVANSAAGLRLIDLAGEPTWRALTAFLLLGPWTPLLFQGQESGSDTPFRYFADHGKDLHRLVVKGRRAFLGQFTRFRGSAGPVTADPAIGEDVFEACRMGRETSRAERCVLLHADLLAMRRHDPSLGQRAERILGATAGDRTLLLRFVGRSAGLDRLLVINLAPDMNLAALPDPVVAPPRDQQWHIRWCSEDPRYGGGGVPASAPPATLIAGGHAATLFDARGLS